MAMMISGIVLSGKAQLSAMSLEVLHPVKPKSLEKRIRRWVKNENVDKNFYYLPYACAVLAQLLPLQAEVRVSCGGEDGRCARTPNTPVVKDKIKSKPNSLIKRNFIILLLAMKRGHSSPQRHNQQ